jgi:glyoxylate carboligase
VVTVSVARRALVRYDQNSSPGGHAAVLDLEDDAAVGIELLAVPVSAVVVQSDHPAVVAREHLLQLGLEGAARVTPVLAELREDGVATR